MSTRKNRSHEDLDVESESVYTGPVRFRRESRGGATRNRTTNSRRKTQSSRRKTNKPGGIHQRANKRTNW